MKISLEPITAIASRSRTEIFAANEALRAGGQPEEHVMIADATGFHLYGDLHLTLELSAATEQNQANLFLEVLEDLARIVSDFARGNRNVLIFEVQGQRIHLFLNRNQLNASNVAELIDFSSYLTDAVSETIKPKVEDYWAGFCMAADFGRAIVLGTGRDGDDSLISLGNPANRPAKRLARSPQVQSGHLALSSEIAEHSDEIRNVDGRYWVGDWIEVNVKDRPRPTQKTENAILFESVLANAKSADDLRRRDRRTVTFAANAAEVAPTTGATVDRPTFVQAFLIRADLDGFTLRVEEVFRRNSQDAIKLLVLEFLQIMKIPDAFESYIERPLIRLPWAGDCYNAILLPKDYEDYEEMREYVAAVAPLRWFDPDGAINATRDKSLAAIAAKKNGLSESPAGKNRTVGC